jgi:diphosphomevalonate decarboxylase
MKTQDQHGETGKITWRCPSNIALVKYWGKKPVQIPANPSISMTLKKAYTEMTMEYARTESSGDLPSVDFWFAGEKNDLFEKKIKSYLKGISEEFPAIIPYHFTISSHNTFPHSAGIASSASSMGALGLCLASFLSLLRNEPFSFRLASSLARLASGSACRSVYGGYTIWGSAEGMEGSSDAFAVPLPFEVHDDFRSMQDAILLVSSKEKAVSSRAGHSLMEQHPYARARYALANDHIRELSAALKSGDMDAFIRITESEALHLHALMMTSPQSYLLIEPGTLHIVKKIRDFRMKNSVPLCFTLDAGPNVHLLYPASYRKEVEEFIKDELLQFCEKGLWIDDETGMGPEKINFNEPLNPDNS